MHLPLSHSHYSWIGVPFVFALGADRSRFLGNDSWLLGTLLTPMAANFNALPAALFEMKDPNGVIKAQVGVAVIMIILHVFLMYYLAF